MTVKELIELLSNQPGDYEVAVRTIDEDIGEIRDDAITDIAEVENPVSECVTDAAPHPGPRPACRLSACVSSWSGGPTCFVSLRASWRCCLAPDFDFRRLTGQGALAGRPEPSSVSGYG